MFPTNFGAISKIPPTIRWKRSRLQASLLEFIMCDSSLTNPKIPQCFSFGVLKFLQRRLSTKLWHPNILQNGISSQELHWLSYSSHYCIAKTLGMSCLKFGPCTIHTFQSMLHVDILPQPSIQFFGPPQPEQTAQVVLNLKLQFRLSWVGPTQQFALKRLIFQHTNYTTCQHSAHLHHTCQQA